MDKIYYKKEVLSNLRNEMTHLWGAAFIFGGGGLSFFMAGLSLINIMLGILGISMSIIFVNAYFIRYNSVNKLINELKGD